MSGRPSNLTIGGNIEEEKKKKIIVVDDEELLLRSHKRTLSRSFEPVTVLADNNTTLEAVVEQVVSTECDAVLTDMIMPVFLGLDLANALLTRGFTKPIIVNSGFMIAGTRERMDALMKVHSNVGFVEKPWSVGDFLAALERAAGASKT